MANISLRQQNLGPANLQTMIQVGGNAGNMLTPFSNHHLHHHHHHSFHQSLQSMFAGQPNSVPTSGSSLTPVSGPISLGATKIILRPLLATAGQSSVVGGAGSNQQTNVQLLAKCIINGASATSSPGIASEANNHRSNTGKNLNESRDIRGRVTSGNGNLVIFASTAGVTVGKNGKISTVSGSPMDTALSASLSARIAPRNGKNRPTAVLVQATDKSKQITNEQSHVKPIFIVHKPSSVNGGTAVSTGTESTIPPILKPVASSKTIRLGRVKRHTGVKVEDEAEEIEVQLNPNLLLFSSSAKASTMANGSGNVEDSFRKNPNQPVSQVGNGGNDTNDCARKNSVPTARFIVNRYKDSGLPKKIFDTDDEDDDDDDHPSSTDHSLPLPSDSDPPVPLIDAKMELSTNQAILAPIQTPVHHIESSLDHTLMVVDGPKIKQMVAAPILSSSIPVNVANSVINDSMSGLNTDDCNGRQIKRHRSNADDGNGRSVMFKNLEFGLVEHVEKPVQLTQPCNQVSNGSNAIKTKPKVVSKKQVLVTKTSSNTAAATTSRRQSKQRPSLDRLEALQKQRRELWATIVDQIVPRKEKVAKIALEQKARRLTVANQCQQWKAENSLRPTVWLGQDCKPQSQLMIPGIKMVDGQTSNATTNQCQTNHIITPTATAALVNVSIENP